MPDAFWHPALPASRLGTAEHAAAPMTNEMVMRSCRAARASHRIAATACPVVSEPSGEHGMIGRWTSERRVTAS